MTHTMDFFTPEEFELINKTQGKKYDKNDPEDKEAYDKLFRAYVKLEYWGNEIKKQLFPNGVFKITKRPTNQGNYFDGYLWSKLYPTASDYENNKWIAITLGLDSNFNYNIKIDTVGLLDGDSKRQNYFQRRGDYNNSPIVKLEKYDAIADWDELITVSKKHVIELLKEYPSFTGNKTTPVKESEKKVTHSLNQILYGPPGTGKTYNTINKALEIINDDDVKKLNFKNREAVKALFNKKMEEGQIVFTTFHQSMSYEDFIEGIKPETLLGNVTYDVIPGIFLDICDLAQNNWEDVREGNKSKLSFEEAFSQLKEDWEEDIETQFPLKTKGKDFTIIGFTKKSIQFRKASGGTGHTLSIGTLKDYYYKKKEVRTTGVGIYYPSILDRLNKYQPEVITEKKLKNYILIIDEINRGNVSQIFGELITLIEEDKRLGKDEALEVTLPYSKEKFGVPPNLYIIGTMNTADRSVEALDTALRRRFSFEEMPPRSKVVEEKGFGDYQRVEIMEKINNRIELLLDRNHTLGHAYFIKENFKNSFENEIIPLLQEYFYNDYGKIGLVLGKGFVRDNSITKSNGQSIFADFETKNEVDIVKSYELIPFAEVAFETALQTLLA
ncbi:McrB family protein [Flavobacterium sp. UBA7682]|uniref:McrB family protein n=1 Tax=Flavobacterium sp. UBA7682 TaxID=1946560 RepID=UPI0025BE36CC|nr:AAA family ATPase [Flavobacterium sp. UBA7682]